MSVKSISRLARAWPTFRTTPRGRQPDAAHASAETIEGSG
jgi:hypothetical protein